MDDLRKDGIGMREWDGPAIMLLDLDAFFASVEQLDHPDWRGKPVIVGGNPDAHGVVSTCSYEAREFGVRSAMPSSVAAKLCPSAIWSEGHFDRYREVSDAVMDIIRQETPHVQQVSIDEAFADITPTRTNREHPLDVAARIQGKVEELGVSCSIGVGVSKSVAKIASDADKPRGLVAVYPGTEESFLRDLPIRSLSGVGPAAEGFLTKHGIETLRQLADAPDALLNRVFGSNAQMMRERARGRDASIVSPERRAKSVSHEVTFSEDLTEREDIEAALMTLSQKVGRRLRMKSLAGKTLTLKMRDSNRDIHTTQRQLSEPIDDEFMMHSKLVRMIDAIWRPGEKVRLLGVAVSGFNGQGAGSQSLFPELAEEPDSMVPDELRRRKLLEATDKLKDKFGEDVVRLGSDFRNAGNTTGSSSKNPADYR